MANPGKPEAKKAFPQALEDAFGIIGEACRKVDINYETYYDWCRKDPDFKDACLKARERGEQRGGDLVEKSLYKKIIEGDTTCLIFYAKTKLRGRGYAERQDSHTHHTYEFGKLNLKSLTEEQIDRLIEDNRPKET